MTGKRSDRLHPAALPVIHRAPWLVTGLASGDAGGGALVADGALAVAGGIIGPRTGFADIRSVQYYK